MCLTLNGGKIKALLRFLCTMFAVLLYLIKDSQSFDFFPKWLNKTLV